MKCVILCGGKGMRMGEMSYIKPKPLAEVNGKPLVLHIMNLYKKHDIKDFILLLGHKGEMIKEYFMNYHWKSNNFKLCTKDHSVEAKDTDLDFNITFLDTGEYSQTGYRINQCKEYIDNETFLMTYGDGLSDINISALIEHHKASNKIATVTGIRRKSQYGVLEVEDGVATSFEEKGYSNEIINGGFFCLNPQVFNYLENHEGCVFEEKPLRSLAKERELSVYTYDGFWKSVDTQKDLYEINNISDRLWER